MLKNIKWNKIVCWHAIDLNSGRQASYNPYALLYPASAYKIFIAAEVLRQEPDLGRQIVVPEWVSKNSALYPINSTAMQGGQIMTIGSLMKKMLQGSDNRASNTLLRLIGGHDSLKNNLMLPRNWWPAADMDQPYYSEKIKISAKDLAVFMVKLNNDELAGSYKLKQYMYSRGNSSETARAANSAFSFMEWSKGGYMEALPRGMPKFSRRFYKSVAAVIDNGKQNYAVGVLTQWDGFAKSNELNFRKIQRQIEARLKNISRF